MSLPRISFVKRILRVEPDPIIITLNSTLEIELYADLTEANFSKDEFIKSKFLRWKIRFENGNPFDIAEKKEFEIITESKSSTPIHADLWRLGKVEATGEYKYGISLVNNISLSKDFQSQEKIIEDIDPYIIAILPRP